MRNLSTYSLTLDPKKMVQLGPESRTSDLYIILLTSPLIKKQYSKQKPKEAVE